VLRLSLRGISPSRFLAGHVEAVPLMDFPGNALTNFYVLVSVPQLLEVPELAHLMSRMTSRTLHTLFVL
jgi:hypothetical protein